MKVDNQSAIAIAYNPEHLQRVKHMERRHFFVRELVENHQIRVPFVRTVDNLADFFTKPLPAKQFFAMRDMIMNVSDPGVGSRGGVDVSSAPPPPPSAPGSPPTGLPLGSVDPGGVTA